MKAKEVIRILIEDGWMFKNQDGSHKHYIHPTKPGKVTVSDHPGDIPKGTFNSILKQAGLK